MARKHKPAETANTQTVSKENVRQKAEEPKPVIVVLKDTDGNFSVTKAHGATEQEYIFAMLALIQEANDTLPEHAPQDITAVHLAC